MAVRLGDLLVKSKLITNEQLQEGLKEVQSSGMKLGEALVKLGYISEDDITETLSAQFGVPSINLSHFEIDPAVLKLVAADVARKYNILPVNKTGATITIAMADPTNVFAMDDIKFMTGYNVEPVVASESSLEDAIEKYYGSTRSLQLKQEGGGGGGGGHQTTTSSNFGKLGEAPSLRDVMDGPTLSFDDMASVGLSEVDID